MDLVASQQRQATNQTLQVRRALNTLREQSQWLGSSICWAKPCAPRWRGCRSALARSSWIRKWRSCALQRLRFEDLLSKQPQLRQIRQADGEPLTSEQNKILQAQLRAQNELLNSLLRARRYPDAGAHQAEGRQRPAGRRAEGRSTKPPTAICSGLRTSAAPSAFSGRWRSSGICGA